MSTPKPRNTEEKLKALRTPRIFLEQSGGGGFSLARDDFEQAQQRFGRRVDELGDLVWQWRSLGEFPQPLGDNPVGKAVANRFTAASGRFVSTLGDYQGKLGDAQGAAAKALRTMVAVENEALSSLQRAVGGGAASITAEDAVALLGQFGFSTARWDDHVVDSAAPEWTPAAKVDWRTYTSQQLYDFATVGNNPDTVFSSIREWRSHEDSLKTSTVDVKNEVGRMMAAWQGGAANAARGALEPLADWGNDAAGNANRLHRDLEKAAEAAAHLRGMPGPVEEPTVADMLHTGLLGSPAQVEDMQQRVQHAQQVKAEQVRYLEQYESTMATVYDSLPNFHLAPEGAGDDPVDPPTPRPPDPGGPGNPVGVPPVRPPAESEAPAGVGTSGPRGGDRELSGTAAGTVSSGATNAANLTTLPPGGLPAPGGDSTVGRGGGPLATGGFVAGTQGNPGQGRTGGDGRAGNLSRGEGRGAGGVNRGLNTAEGPAGATRRGAGTVPAGGAPGKRSEGADDIEHDRPSYLVERDPQGLFGTDERTAPPVIG